MASAASKSRFVAILHQAAAWRRLNVKRSALTNAAVVAEQANSGSSPIKEDSDLSTQYESSDSGQGQMLTNTEAPAEWRIVEKTRDRP
jgi:hypothetical protein